MEGKNQIFIYIHEVRGDNDRLVLFKMGRRAYERGGWSCRERREEEVEIWWEGLR